MNQKIIFIITLFIMLSKTTALFNMAPSNNNRQTDQCLARSSNRIINIYQGTMATLTKQKRTLERQISNLERTRQARLLDQGHSNHANDATAPQQPYDTEIEQLKYQLQNVQCKISMTNQETTVCLATLKTLQLQHNDLKKEHGILTHRNNALTLQANALSNYQRNIYSHLIFLLSQPYAFQGLHPTLNLAIKHSANQQQQLNGLSSQIIQQTNGLIRRQKDINTLAYELPTRLYTRLLGLTQHAQQRQ